MTPSELRAAAERVIQTYVTDPEMLGVHIHPTMTELASVDCARHILATVRTDDGEPVNDPSLREMGFEPAYGIGSTSRILGWHHGKAQQIFVWEDLSKVWVGNVATIVNPTRGQLRNLLSALGIEARAAVEGKQA